jgi:hypothetical protein
MQFEELPHAASEAVTMTAFPQVSKKTAQMQHTTSKGPTTKPPQSTKKTATAEPGGLKAGELQVWGEFVSA